MRAELKIRIANDEIRLKRHIENNNKRPEFIRFLEKNLNRLKVELKRLDNVEIKWQKKRAKFNFEEVTKIIFSINNGYKGIREVFYLNLEKQTFFTKEDKFKVLQDERNYCPKIKIPDAIFKEILVKLKSCEFSTWESSYLVPNLHDFPVWNLQIWNKNKSSLAFYGHTGPDGYHIFQEIKNELTENK